MLDKFRTRERRTCFNVISNNIIVINNIRKEL